MPLFNLQYQVQSLPQLYRKATPLDFVSGRMYVGIPSHMTEPLWHTLKADKGRAVVSYDFLLKK